MDPEEPMLFDVFCTLLALDNSVYVYAVEALRQVKLKLRSLEVETTHEFLFSILSPRQAAYVKLKIEMTRPIQFWTDWMLIFYKAIILDDYNRSTAFLPRA